MANLLNLFWVDPPAIERWQNFDERRRRNHFSPAGVRKELERLNRLIPVDQAHYQRLCESYVHPGPSTSPNSHENPKQPVLGALFQPSGFELGFWELCWVQAMISGPIAKIG